MSIIEHPEGWPLDSSKCVFVGHAIEQIGAAEIWRALKSGKLQVGVIIVGAKDWRTPMPIAPLVFQKIDSRQTLEDGQIDWLDRHPGTPVSHRRRIPVPHWLYVTRQSLALLEAAQSRRKGSRHASDDGLVAEGLAGINNGRWRNARRAALELASRAQGASPEAKIDRLARKIKKAIGE